MSDLFGNHIAGFPTRQLKPASDGPAPTRRREFKKKILHVTHCIDLNIGNPDDDKMYFAQLDISL